MQSFESASVIEPTFPVANFESPSPGSLASHKAWETAKARAVAETRKTPYELREQVCLCTDAGLGTFAKLLFVRLTDMAFKDAFRRGDGVVECSKKFLADDFGVSVDTVTRATRQLCKSGFLWTKSMWKGSFEITWWFIRDWADDSKEYDRHSGSNFGRRINGVQRNTVRGAGGKFAQNPESMRSKFRAWMASRQQGATVKAEISPDHGQESALTTRNGNSGQGRTISLDQPQESALTARRNQPCQHGEISPDSTEKSALTTGSHQPGPAAQMPGLATLQTIKGDGEEDSFKRSTGFNAQKATGKGRGRASRANLFLLDVAAMMERWRKGSSAPELKNSGAWWRLAYNADHDLMERVLAETLRAVKESQVQTTPGQYAADLWRRWGGKLPAKEGGR